MHQDVGGDAEEAGITPCPAREAAQGTASKTQGEGKCQQRAEAGPPLVVPALLLGRECPLMGTGCSLPSSVESTKTGASSSALPPDHGKDAQDEQGMDGGCWHCRTSELPLFSASVLTAALPLPSLKLLLPLCKNLGNIRRLKCGGRISGIFEWVDLISSMSHMYVMRVCVCVCV